ncbi:MAG: hypothetical protein ACRC6V_01445 [Bacteroidales bacterium]
MIYDPELKLSDHFKYKELIKSDTAIAKGIDNNVPEEVYDVVIANAKYVAETLLEPLRKIYGPFTLNSWFRGERLEFAITRLDGFTKHLTKYTSSKPLLNTYLKYIRTIESLDELVRLAKTDSTVAEIYSMWRIYFARKNHPQGTAVDIKIAKAGSIQALYLQCKALKLPYDQIILEMHKPAIPMSGWVHYSILDESTPANMLAGRKNRYQDFAIS